MAGLAPVELSADCEACGLEGGVVEVYDALVAACRFGVPATTRCKLCGGTREGVFDRTPTKPLREIPANRCPCCLYELSPAALDERCCGECGARAALVETIPPIRFTTIADLERALDAWAEHEKFPTREALASATFAEPDITKIFGALMRRERIEILADPFANMGVRTKGGSSRQKGDVAKKTDSSVIADAPATVRDPLTNPAPAPITATATVPDARPVDAHAPVETHTAAAASPPVIGAFAPEAFAPTDPVARPLEPPPPSAPPRAIVYPLVSVIAADGEIHPEERALVDRFLQGEGLAPLAEHEFRVHHPSEVAHLVPTQRREDVVKLMCESASVDGMPDESERRVIRAYATAWNVDDEKLEFWMWGYESMNTSLTRALWLKLRRFVLSARWSESESKE